ncbi:hypothetical protein Tco_1270813 [Tanacetum coccineum]
MRLDVLKFNGVDPGSWIFVINEYFELLETTLKQRFPIIGFNLEGDVAEWYRWMTCYMLITSWDGLLENVHNLITEYLVNISKRRAFWSLNEDILKITILTTNTPYPSRKIRCIRACTHQRPQRKQVQYAVSSKAQYAVLEI